MENSAAYRRPILATALLIVGVGIWLLCEIPRGYLTNTDELLTAERTREMLLLGKSTVHLNFEVSANKPPLQYWLGTSTLGQIQNREFALRIWPVVFGILTAAALAWLAFLVDRERPWTIFGAVAILFSCPLYLPEIARAYLDSGLTFFITLAVIFSQLARKQPIWWIATGFACWLAALQKIPLGYLIWFLILLARLLSSRERAQLRTRWLFGAIILSFVALVVWPSILNGSHGFSVSDALRISEAKILTGPNQLGKHLFLEVPLRLVGFWPFGIFALAAAIAVLASSKFREDIALRELAVVALSVLVLLVAFGFRSVRYILPIIPLLSLMVAAVILPLPKPRPIVARIALVVTVALFFAGIVESVIVLRGRRHDVTNELKIARRLHDLEKPGVSTLVIRTHFKEVGYATFYLFYGELRFPVTELMSEEITKAKITPPAIGVSTERDFQVLREKLPKAVIDLQSADLVCWRAAD